MKVRFGTYAGDGIDNRSIPLDDITPDAIIIKGDAFLVETQMWIRTMGMDNTNSDGTGFYTGGIKQVNTDEMVLGTDIRVNAAGNSYVYWAFEDTGAGDFRFFSYIGDGTDNRSLDLALTPDMAFIFSDGTPIVWGCTAHPQQDDDATRLKSSTLGGTAFANKIQKFDDCGIEIGNSGHVNDGGVSYYGIALKEIPDTFEVVSYIGDASASRDIEVGFQPYAVMIETTAADAIRPAVLSGPNPGDVTLPITAIYARLDTFGGFGIDATLIREYNATSFTIGNHAWVNENGKLFVGWAVRNNADFAEPENLEIAIATQISVEVVQTFEVTPNTPGEPENPCLSPELVSVSACPDLPEASRPVAVSRLGFISLPGCKTLPSASHPAPRVC